jgi:hypothetical protein
MENLHTRHAYTVKPNRCTLATRAGSELAEVYTLLELGEVDTPPLELAEVYTPYVRAG